jgi:hypothetical protein
MRKRLTEEEKIAVSISKIVSDLRLDLEMIGVYLAYYLPNVSYRRFQLIAEASKEAKEGKSNEYEY